MIRARLALLLGAALFAGCDGAGCAVALTCGGGGGDSTPSAPMLTGPADFALPYGVVGSSDDSFELVPASSPATKVPVAKPVAGSVDEAVTLAAGDWMGGIVANSRPMSLLYAQTNQWYRMPLRQGTSVSPVAFGAEAGAVCNFSRLVPYYSFIDYATPSHSWFFYQADPSSTTCSDADPLEFHALRLDDGASTAPRLVGQGAEPLRAFYAGDGAITGFIVRVGSSIAYCDANLANPVTLVSNATGIGRAGTFARTGSTIYVRYGDSGGTGHVDRITSDGVRHALFSMPNASISNGYSDDQVLYVRQRVSGAYQLVRVPYDGSATSTIYSSSTFFYIVGVTSHAVIIDSEPDGEELLAIDKNSGATVKSLATAGVTFLFNAPPLVVGDRVVWTAYDGDPSAYPTSSHAGISLDDGTVIEQHAKSEWLNIYSATFDYTKAVADIYRAGMLAHDYTSADWSQTGDQGATVAAYNLLTGGKQDGLMTFAGPGLMFLSLQQFGLGTYFDLSSGHTDVFLVDGQTPSVVNITNTPTSDEFAVPVF